MPAGTLTQNNDKPSQTGYQHSQSALLTAHSSNPTTTYEYAHAKPWTTEKIIM